MVYHSDVRIDRVDMHERGLEVYWSDGSSADFPYIFLRHNDPRAFHPDTHERQHDLYDIDLAIRPVRHVRRVDGDGIDALSITWPDLEGEGVFTQSWLSRQVADRKSKSHNPGEHLCAPQRSSPQ